MIQRICVLCMFVVIPTLGVHCSHPEEDGKGSPNAPSSRTFSHVAGLRFCYPAGWRLVSEDGEPSLAPAAAFEDPTELAELYRWTVQRVPGAGSAADPDLIAALGTQLGQQVPGYQAIGAPEVGRAGGHPSVTFHFRGRVDGRNLEGHARCLVEREILFSLVGFGREALIREHEPAIQTVFESLQVREPRRDARLVGRWSHGSAYTNAVASFSMATEDALVLAADGSYARSQITAGGNDLVGASSGESAERGAWFADQGVLFLLADGGDVTRFSYTLESGCMVTTFSGGHRTLWSR